MHFRNVLSGIHAKGLDDKEKVDGGIAVGNINTELNINKTTHANVGLNF